MTRPLRISIPDAPTLVANENIDSYYYGYLDQTRPPWPLRGHGQKSEAVRNAQGYGYRAAREDGWIWTIDEIEEGEALHAVLTCIREVEWAMSDAHVDNRVQWSRKRGEELNAETGPKYSDMWPGGIEAVLRAF